VPQPEDKTLLSRFTSVTLLLALCGCTAAEQPSPTILTPSGLCVVRLGMSVTEVQTALGAQLAPMAPGSEAACWMTRRADGRAPQVFYMVQNDTITRIDINTAASAGTPADVKTAAGIGVGATEADVAQAYGKSAKVMPSKYDAHGHTITVEPGAGKSALVFEASDGKVTTFRAGLHPAVDYVEGCS
jgi:hypothetical protein